MSMILPALGLVVPGVPVPAIIEREHRTAAATWDGWHHLWRAGGRQIAAPPRFVVLHKGVVERADDTLEIFDPRLLYLATLGLMPLTRPELVFGLQNTVDYTSGSGTYTTPSGISQLIVEPIGGGGGGGSGSSNTGGGGGGGAGRVTIVTSSGTGYSYGVGNGGSPSNSGGATTFNGTAYKAFGGTFAAGSNGSAGGPGGPTSGLDEGHTGGDGGTGNASTGGGGAGGSAASPDADGNNGADGTGPGAAGGASPGGLAGRGGNCAAFNSGVTSEDGQPYGGGGSGAAGGAGTGPGSGAGGHLRVKEYGY